VYEYLFKQSFRAIKIQLKNYFTVILGIIFVSAVFLHSIITGIYESSFTLSENLFLVSLAISILQLFIVLSRKTLVFAMHPAAIHYFYNTKEINRVKAILITQKIIKNIILSLAICLFIFNFRFSLNLFTATIILFAYAMTGSFIRWLKYIQNKPLVLTGFYIGSSALFILSFSNYYIMAVIPLYILLILLIIYCERVKMDWGKYYDDALYANRINSSGRHRNIAEMQQITAEHIAKRKHSIKIYDLPLNRKSAMICKAMIETLRMSKQVAGVLALILVFAVLLNKTSLFSHMPLVGNPNISNAICIFAIGAFLANLREIYFKQISSVYDKHLKGFFIPYSYSNIVFSYGIVCSIITTLSMTVLCFVLTTGLVKGLFILLIINLAMFLSFLLQPKQQKNGAITIITNIVFILSARLFF